jgi:hypothetical protein
MKMTLRITVIIKFFYISKNNFFVILNKKLKKNNLYILSIMRVITEKCKQPFY